MKNYQRIAAINEEHQVFLVQDPDTKRVYIEKVQHIYNLAVYEQLSQKPISGTPRIIDFEENDGCLTLVEEYIGGKTLQELVDERSLTDDLIKNYCCKLCDTLSELHSLTPPIIHRDIKPSNVIITRDDIPVLLDFNAAKSFSESELEDTVLLGTQGHAAPEQFGFGASSPRTDIYAMGILLREMINSIDEHGKWAEPIIKSCTQLDPEKRYHNVSELKAALLGDEIEIEDEKKYRRLPVGFRSRTPWKMLLASVGYAFIIYISFTIEIESTNNIQLWLNRAMTFVMSVMVVFCVGDYMGIKRLFPLCYHEKRIVRFLSSMCLAIVVILFCMIILMMIESIFF